MAVEMKPTKLFFFLASCVLLIFSAAKGVRAQDSPVQIALFNPIQLDNENTSIVGLRIDLIYGKNTSVTGFDWGMINHTTSGTSKGVQWSLVGFNDANFTGWQSSFVGVTKGKFEGLQWGVVNYAGTMSGVQIGLVNYAANMTKGLQIGLVNIIKQGGQFPVFPIVNWAF
jgi:hypothetical protein